MLCLLRIPEGGSAGVRSEHALHARPPRSVGRKRPQAREVAAAGVACPVALCSHEAAIERAGRHRARPPAGFCVRPQRQASVQDGRGFFGVSRVRVAHVRLGAPRGRFAHRRLAPTWGLRQYANGLQHPTLTCPSAPTASPPRKRRVCCGGRWAGGLLEPATLGAPGHHQHAGPRNHRREKYRGADRALCRRPKKEKPRGQRRERRRDE